MPYKSKEIMSVDSDAQTGNLIGNDHSIPFCAVSARTCCYIEGYMKEKKGILYPRWRNGFCNLRKAEEASNFKRVRNSAVMWQITIDLQLYDRSPI
jgi:hypothetical protein